MWLEARIHHYGQSTRKAFEITAAMHSLMVWHVTTVNSTIFVPLGFYDFLTKLFQAWWKMKSYRQIFSHLLLKLPIMMFLLLKTRFHLLKPFLILFYLLMESILFLSSTHNKILLSIKCSNVQIGCHLCWKFYFLDSSSWFNDSSRLWGSKCKGTKVIWLWSGN